METETAAAAPVTTPKVRRPRIASEAKTATVTLRGADGSQCILVAERKADGTARTYVLVLDAAKKTTRGMTEQHATFDEAKAAIAAQAAKAEKLGWYRKPVTHHFAVKPDAFTALPKPPAPAPAAKATPKSKK